MSALSWWTSIVVLAVASGIDLRTRRIPNWLVVPFLLAGVAAQSISGHLSGAGRSLAGVGLACLLFGIPCFIGGMGMGDLKLAAGVGAWVGPSQLFTASIFTALIGGVLAVGWALWRGSLTSSLDSAGDLLTPWRVNRPDRPGADAAIPYAPAIALGTLLSFLAR